MWMKSRRFQRLGGRWLERLGIGFVSWLQMLNPGGVMLSHDYSLLTGVAKACDEFLEDKPEALIELPTTQCMVIKL